MGAYSLIDGSYVIPVAEGSYYVGIEPLDGDPAALDPARINGVIAFTLDTAFSEELYDANEASIDRSYYQHAISSGYQSGVIAGD